jgi:hypothetical protein
MLESPSLHALIIFNPGQRATRGYFFIMFTRTRAESDSCQPGQQFSTRVGSSNIPSDELDQTVIFCKQDGGQ